MRPAVRAHLIATRAWFKVVIRLLHQLAAQRADLILLRHGPEGSRSRPRKVRERRRMLCPTGNATNRMWFAGFALVQRCAQLRRSALSAPHRTKATTEETVERGPSEAK
jgi:hypothetical protein